MSTQLNMKNQFDFAVVGGGCIGVSTALALQREWPDAKIILFEGSETKTASKDNCKTIRTPYFDEEYVTLAKESKGKWETLLPYCKFYRRTGWIQVVRGGNYKPFHPEERSIKVKDLSAMVRSRDPPQLDIGEELWLNEDIGIADSALALEAVAVEAAVRGVKRQQEDVSKLLITNGICYGVECIGGINITAKTTFVATGPWTPALLESSKIQLPHDFQDGFLSVTAIGVATLPLDEDEYARFKSMPILVTEKGEVMPPTAQQNALQITSTDTFTITHPDELKSMDLTKKIKTNRAVLEKMLPEMKGRPLNYSLCPDLITPYQHPLLDQVPGVQGLHLAVGGSYHSFKFLPVFGDIVVAYLRGTRNGVSKRWGWNRSEEKLSAHSEVLPKGSF